MTEQLNLTELKLPVTLEFEFPYSVCQWEKEEKKYEEENRREVKIPKSSTCFLSLRMKTS